MAQREQRRRGASATGDPAEDAREIALRLLQHSARSAAQLKEGLIARDVDPSLAEQIVDRYREVGLIDDAALAASIVRTRHQERGRSRRAIAQELRRKGFAEDDAQAALAQVSDDDEWEAARDLAARRWAALGNVEEHVRIRRVVAMLGRRGYAPSVAFALVKDLSRADNGED